MLSVDQIQQLAPDAASLKAGRDQSKPAKWKDSGTQGDFVWGCIQGSGKEPYRTIVDLRGPAYSCSCPSRKFPCKHSLGLLFLAAETGLSTLDVPDWVNEWSSKRAASAEKKAAREQAAVNKPVDAGKAAEREEASAKRAARRDALMGEGLTQTRIWLEDLITQGLAWAQAQPLRYWSDQIARLTNAQLPGVARMVDEAYAAAHSGDGWPPRLLGELSRLHLLCRSWERIDKLDAARAAELRSLIGQPVPQESVLAQNGISGTWQVLARIYEERDKLRSYRHWLWCRETDRITQVFEFAAGSQPLDTSLGANTVFEGELVFYPGMAPLRALIKRRAPSSAQPGLVAAKGDGGLQAPLGAARAFWALHPWARQIPMLFTATPRPDLGGFVDAAGQFLHWEQRFPDAWMLAALSGGKPLHVFGELQNGGFTPLMAATAESRRVWNQRYER